MSDTAIAILNEQNATNQLHYRHNHGPRDIYESFAQYISGFTDDVKMPLENHPFIQELSIQNDGNRL